MSATHDAVFEDPRDPGWLFTEKDRLLDEQRRELEEARRRLAEQAQVIGEQRQTIANGAAEITRRDAELTKLRGLIEAAKEKLEWFQRQVFGRRSEKLPRADLAKLEELVADFGQLFGWETAEGVKGGLDAAGTSATPPPGDKTPSPEEKEGEEGSFRIVDVPGHQRRIPGHGRKPLPQGLPRLFVPHELPEEARLCPCCKDPMERVAWEETKLLEHLLPLFYVLVHARAKYACNKKGCETKTKPVVAPLPLLPIHKGKAGAGLLAHVLISKYEDHLPLHRQQKIFLRYGIEIAESTLGGWVTAMGELLAPLAGHIAKRVVASDIIETDDTKLPVLPKPSPRGSKEEQREPKSVVKGHLWGYRGDATSPYVAFHWTPTWSAKEGPELFLKDFHGTYLQADAYKGYDALFKSRPTTKEVGCMAHTRRKFHDAFKLKAKRAQVPLALIQALYRIEKQAKADKLGPEARKALRQQHAPPLFAKLREWLDREGPGIPPETKLGKAVTYANNQWDALQRYLEDGRLQIDNNLMENDLRPIAVGRSNWSFAGSAEAAQRAAHFYTLVASARRNEVEPYAYLRYVIAQLPRLPEKAKDKEGKKTLETPESEAFLDTLLPDRWKQTIQGTDEILAHLAPEILDAFLASLTRGGPPPDT